MDGMQFHHWLIISGALVISVIAIGLLIVYVYNHVIKSIAGETEESELITSHSIQPWYPELDECPEFDELPEEECLSTRSLVIGEIDPTSVTEYVYHDDTNVTYSDENPPMDLEHYCRTESGRYLRRSGFTNEQIVELIKGSMLEEHVDHDDAAKKLVSDYNWALSNLIDLFDDFSRPLDEMGALALEEKTGMIIHVGRFPDEDRIPVSGSRSE